MSIVQYIQLTCAHTVRHKSILGVALDTLATVAMYCPYPVEIHPGHPRHQSHLLLAEQDAPADVADKGMSGVVTHPIDGEGVCECGEAYDAFMLMCCGYYCVCVCDR